MADGALPESAEPLTPQDWRRLRNILSVLPPGVPRGVLPRVVKLRRGDYLPPGGDVVVTVEELHHGTESGLDWLGATVEQDGREAGLLIRVEVIRRMVELAVRPRRQGGGV
ncbi:hypothetical protein I0C86_12710 [Plantactinospora sp. S1510]|uniref:Uncharacterized protein n=1 Tax=Plantactinospora alkalitolerans TaxID=2789879 RepID=A0ABS0GUD1_9ACTN|nr:hypothetical protein [Plantactinospora alkalitolerans]MBF9129814.1 hypothetical protein [Plantactinospora alkalitolerans]